MIQMANYLRSRFLSAILLLVVPVMAQTPSTPVVTRHVVIRAGHLLDVKTGNMLTGQAITIEGDKIVSVGPAADIKSDPGTEVVDLPNATVLPGLIDAHTHLTGDPKDLGYESLGISIPRETLIGARNARVTLRSWLHNRAQRRSRRLQRCRPARRDQRRRYPRPAHAGERPTHGHYRRTLRRQSARP